MRTDYDDMRDRLREKLTECLNLAREMLDEEIWGYKSMGNSYSEKVYLAVKKTRDAV